MADDNVIKMQPPPPRRQAIDWENLPVHPAAAAWPEMSDAQVSELAKDIAERGLQIPLVVFVDNSDVVNGSEGPFPKYLLDGRGRRKALAKNGITNPHNAKGGEGGYDLKVRTVEAMKLVSEFSPSIGGTSPHWVPDVDPYAFVLTVNAHRLHLNAEQKRDAIKAAIAARPRASNREIARTVGVDDTTVGDIRRDPSRNAGIPQNSNRPIEIARIALLANPNRTNTTIANEIGVSDHTVGKARKELEAEGEIQPRKTEPTTKTTSKPKRTTTSKPRTTTTANTKKQQKLAETARTNEDVAAWLKEHAANAIPAWITWLETMDNKEVIRLLEKKE